MDRETAARVLVPLLLLCALFLYSGARLPGERPRTVQILDDSGSYDGCDVRMVGNFVGRVDGDLVLERFGREFQVRVGNFERGLEEGDLVSAKGVYRSDGGYLEATEVHVGSVEDRDRLYPLSILGLAFVLVVLYTDREDVLKVVPWPTG